MSFRAWLLAPLSRALREQLFVQHFELQLQRYANPHLFDGTCPTCGGKARLVHSHSPPATYIRALGVDAPDERFHPAHNGWPEARTQERLAELWPKPRA